MVEPATSESSGLSSCKALASVQPEVMVIRTREGSNGQFHFPWRSTVGSKGRGGRRLPGAERFDALAAGDPPSSGTAPASTSRSTTCPTRLCRSSDVPSEFQRISESAGAGPLIGAASWGECSRLNRRVHPQTVDWLHPILLVRGAAATTWQVDARRPRAWKTRRWMPIMPPSPQPFNAARTIDGLQIAWPDPRLSRGICRGTTW